MQNSDRNNQENLGCWKRFCNKIKNCYSQLNRIQIDRRNSQNSIVNGNQIGQNTNQQLDRDYMQRIRVQQIKITAGSQLEQNQQDRGSFQNNYIACNLCDQIMQENVYQIHIKMCEQQIKNGNLFEQECQQCGLIIIKLYYNDHLDICEANCWIQVKCPYCFIAVFKVDLKDHISKCSFFLNQQQKEKEGIQNCAVCLEDVIENKSQLNCSHIFHQDCINNWLILHRNCPICKKTQDK